MQDQISPGLFMRRLYSLLMVTALLLGTSFFAHAQTAGTASIQGTVTDPTGASIPNAKVTFTNTGTHTSRATVTDGAGIFSLPNVTVGAYSLTIAAQGFQGYTRTGVLEVGNNVQINPALTIGSSTEHVEVQATGAALDTETRSSIRRASPSFLSTAVKPLTLSSSPEEP
jgi:hypothetical protein